MSLLNLKRYLSNWTGIVKKLLADGRFDPSTKRNRGITVASGEG
jgi:hypothetical protein